MFRRKGEDTTVQQQVPAQGMRIAPKRSLQDLDVVLLVDKSGSMDNRDGSTKGKTRWDYVRETVGQIIEEVQQYDSDGITLGFFSSTFDVTENVTSDVAMRLYRNIIPGGGTVLAPALNYAFKAYANAKRNGTLKSSGMIVLVVHDGEAGDKREVEDAIVNFANTLTPQEADTMFGIGFIQVGDDRQAREFLRHLDDGLGRRTGGKDIVDVKTSDEVARIGLREAIRQALVD